MGGTSARSRRGRTRLRRRARGSFRPAFASRGDRPAAAPDLRAQRRAVGAPSGPRAGSDAVGAVPGRFAGRLKPRRVDVARNSLPVSRRDFGVPSARSDDQIRLAIVDFAPGFWRLYRLDPDIDYAHRALYGYDSGSAVSRRDLAGNLAVPDRLHELLSDSDPHSAGKPEAVQHPRQANLCRKRRLRAGVGVADLHDHPVL